MDATGNKLFASKKCCFRFFRPWIRQIYFLFPLEKIVEKQFLFSVISDYNGVNKKGILEENCFHIKC